MPMMRTGYMINIVTMWNVINAILELLRGEMCRLINAYYAMNTLMINVPCFMLILLDPNNNA